jgi:MarR family transcriptional regulator, 2-MHQ and catechol-resistance regulon repressor
VKLARAAATFQRHAVEDIRTYGLTLPQFGVIESLGHLGAMTLGELAQKQLSSCGNTTVVVDNLETEGLVERNASKEDRRVIYVRLTPKGKRLFNDAFKRHAKVIAQLASVLTECEQLELAKLLKKLGRSLAQRS